MLLNEKIINKLFDKAEISPRLRANLCLHTSSEDKVQKMINVLFPGTNVPIHRHINTDETLAIIRGSIDIIFYDDRGLELEKIRLNSLDCPVVDIKKNTWHTVFVTEPVALLEIKEGPYISLKPEEVWA